MSNHFVMELNDVKTPSFEQHLKTPLLKNRALQLIVTLLNSHYFDTCRLHISPLTERIWGARRWWTAYECMRRGMYYIDVTWCRVYIASLCTVQCTSLHTTSAAGAAMRHPTWERERLAPSMEILTPAAPLRACLRAYVTDDVVSQFQKDSA